jgi:hypothetical protein
MSPYLQCLTRSDAHGGHTAISSQGAPLFYLSNFFKQWRGSYDVTFKFVKTQFHSGRLQITWTPNMNVGLAPTPTTGILSLRQIVDIREQDEFTFNLPYMVPDPYLATSSLTYPRNSSGQLDVVILNDLMAPETCSQSISILVFIKGGPDFEFQVPGNNAIGPQAYGPQSAQEDILYHGGIADSKIESPDTSYSAASVGEHFTSIKQFLNRFSQIINFSGSAFPGAVTNFTLYPWYAGSTSISTSTGALTSGPLGGDAFSIFSPMYLYRRGSVRLCVSCDKIMHINAGNVASGTDISTWTSPVIVQNLVPGLAHSFTAANTAPSAGHQPLCGIAPNELGPGFSYIHCPYYSRYPVSLIPNFDGNLNLTPVQYTMPWTTAVFAAPSSFDVTTLVFRSFGDDFQLSFFIAAPPILTAYS